MSHVLRTDTRRELDNKPVFEMKLCLPGHQSSISPVVESLMDVVREAPCAGKDFEIETALREALANAVFHGCRNDSAKTVQCALSWSESGDLTIVVRDPGPGFDPASVPNPVAEDNLFSRHGRGIYLITHLMDDVWFEHGGSEVHMILKQSGAHPGAA